MRVYPILTNLIEQVECSEHQITVLRLNPIPRQRFASIEPENVHSTIQCGLKFVPLERLAIEFVAEHRGTVSRVSIYRLYLHQR